MKIIITTNRFYIREFVSEDAEDLYNLESDSRVNKYIPGSRLMSINKCKREINNYINNYKKSDLGRWAIFLRDTNEFVGVTGFRYLPSIKKTEIGLKILPKYWGNGYATEIGNSLIHHGLTKLNLNEIIAMADPNNARAVKTIENYGMSFVKNGYYNGNKVVYFNALQ